MKKTLIALSLAVAFTSASAANLQMPQSDNESSMTKRLFMAKRMS